MAENFTLARQYARTDLFALRAYVQRIASAVIARIYYNTDEHPHAATPAAMDRYLRQQLDGLVTFAIAHGSTVLAKHLRDLIKQHGHAKVSSTVYRMVEDAAQLAFAAPQAEHPVSMWFRPIVAQRLMSAQLKTLGDVVAFCNRRGSSWWRSIPRIGPGRARILVAWLRRHCEAMGLRVEKDVDLDEPFIAVDIVDISAVGEGGASGSLAPLERMAVSPILSGADGENRATAFCYIQAKHDLDAVRSYLHRYRDQPKTLRAYTKELERFLLCAVVVRKKPMSSLLVSDCEAYKDFLHAPDAAFVGERFSRQSPRWRPFETGSLSAESRRYEVRALRGAFDWWVDVRYLAGNPWNAVNDPSAVEREAELQIQRALSASLWKRLWQELDQRCEAHDGVQWRITAAAILSMGDSGLRREEAAGAMREKLKLSIYGTVASPVWELTVIGKRKRQRTVPLSPATVLALRAHWEDHGWDFDGRTEDRPLLSPIVVPATVAAKARHRTAVPAAYTADGLKRLIDRGLMEMSATMRGLTEDERTVLQRVSAHAFRHTFGTQSVFDNVPVDVVQMVLGHASLPTTSLYVQAEKQRMLEEGASFYARPHTGTP